jgi:hypothetical protein
MFRDRGVKPTLRSELVENPTAALARTTPKTARLCQACQEPTGAVAVDAMTSTS